MRFWPRKEHRDTSGITLKNPGEAFIRDIREYFGVPTATGKALTVEGALTGTVAVYACVGLIADAISTLPCLLYSEDDRGQRSRVPRGDPFARMLHRVPNPELTAQEVYETAVGHMLTWGNHYGYLVRDGAGRVREIWPLRPDRMEVWLLDASTGKLFDPGHVDPERVRTLTRLYRYQLPSGEWRNIPRSDVFHPRGLASNGFIGHSPIRVAATQIALEQAASEHGARFFANAAIPGGILKFPETQKKLEKPDKDRIREEWKQRFGGLSKAHTMAVLEGGVSWESIGIPNEDAQWIETRKFQITEIARLYRVPPHLVSDVEKSTSWGTGIEQQAIGFLTYTLRPWIERLEQAMDRDLGSGRGGALLSDSGRVVEFLVEGLLRADTESRWKSYEIAIRTRGMVPNEARTKENMLPLPGGDEPLIPMNMSTGEATLKEKVDAAGALVRAGYDPAGALAAVGLPAITHSGLIPVTVQPEKAPPKKPQSAA